MTCAGKLKNPAVTTARETRFTEGFLAVIESGFAELGIKELEKRGIIAS